MAPNADLLVVGAREVLTCEGPGPLRGDRQGAVGCRRGAAVAIGGGEILAVGDERDLRARFPVGDAGIVDAAGKKRGPIGEFSHGVSPTVMS